MEKKVEKMLFSFEIIAFELVALNTRFYLENILVIGCQYFIKQSQDFRFSQNRVFGADFFWEWSKNITKILPSRLKQRLRFFNMLTVHKCSDRRFFGVLSNSAFSSQWFQKEITSDPQLFFQSITNFT